MGSCTLASHVCFLNVQTALKLRHVHTRQNDIFLSVAIASRASAWLCDCNLVAFFLIGIAAHHRLRPPPRDGSSLKAVQYNRGTRAASLKENQICYARTERVETHTRTGRVRTDAVTVAGRSALRLKEGLNTRLTTWRTCVLAQFLWQRRKRSVRRRNRK